MGLGAPGFIGCLHLGHEAVARWRGFEDSNEQDDYLISQWNKVVDTKDLVYILGDVTMNTSEHYYKLDLLKGRKIVVLGNHDNPRDVKELLNYVETVAGMIDYKGFCLTHCPIHPSEIHFYRGNIHAHIHHKNKLEHFFTSSSYLDDDAVMLSTAGKYHNVDAKMVDFTPKTIEQLLHGN